MKAVLLLVAFTAVLIQNTWCQELGSDREANLSDQEKNRLLEFSLDAFYKVSNSPYQHKVVRVNDIKYQRANGIVYKLNLELGETTCSKGNAGADCKLRNSGTLKCAIDVYERPWENFTETKVKSCVG